MFSSPEFHDSQSELLLGLLLVLLRARTQRKAPPGQCYGPSEIGQQDGNWTRPGTESIKHAWERDGVMGITLVYVKEISESH